jgi:hypothetical protein
MPGGGRFEKLCQRRETIVMKTHASLTAIALSLWFASSASAQVVGGVMTVTGAEMH